MPEPQGTLQSLGLALSEILSPLERELEPSQARVLLYELGIPVPEASVNQIVGPLQTTVAQVSEVLALAQQLIAVLESDNQLEIIRITPDLIVKIGGAIDGFGAVAAAIGSLGLSVPPSTIDDLPRNLLNHLLVRRFSVIRGLNELLEFLGVLEQVIENADSTDPNNPPFVRFVFNFANLTRWAKKPKQQLQTLFDWDDDSIDAIKLFTKLEKLLFALGTLPFFDPLSTPPKIELIISEVIANTDVTPPGLEIRLRTGMKAGEYTIPLDEEIKFIIKIGFDTAFGSGVLIQPNGNATLLSPVTDVTTSGQVELRFEADRTSVPNKYVLLGEAGGNRLEIGKFVARTGVEVLTGSGETEAVGKFFVAGELVNGKLFLDLSKGDGFISSLLPGAKVDSAFEVAFGYDSDQGLFFRGSSALKIQIPTHVVLGPVEISAISLGLDFQEDTLPFFAAANIKTKLGPLVAVIDGIGLTTTLQFKDDHDGNFGPVDVSIRFKPPQGIGLSIDGGGFKGGGFLGFDPEAAFYSGMMELEFQDQFTLKAFGLLNTRLPNGQRGFSLLIVISSEFTPIQLGLGFKLNGVGGLLGLNRTVNVEPLRAGLRANTLSSILFPTDIVANADRIISDLKQIFPPQDRRFIFGPMAKIGWGTPTLLTIDLGLVIEIPDPVRLFILGVLRAVLPDEKAVILQVQVNFLGEINFERRQLKFDASLFDSKLLGFNLSGDMAIRLDWGADANFLLTVGGFHPAYEPPPMDLPAIRRLTLSLLSGDNPRLRLEMYLAVTSNTAQFGAKLELFASASKFNVYGFLSFDVLFQFNPFYFIAEITAMLALRIGSSSIASIKLTLTLEGPTPWKAQGTASFKICWFFTLKVRFNKTFGESRNTTLPDLTVLPLLAEALRADDNWEAELPVGRHRLESIREAPELTGELLMHPIGTLKISQKVVPLNVRIDRIGSQRPSDGREFRIVNPQPPVTTNTPQEAFAPAQFFDLTDEQKLTSASFKDLDSGIRVGDATQLHTGYAAAREVQYEVKYIDSQRDQRLSSGGKHVLDDGAFNSWTLQGAIAQSELSFARKRKSSLAPEAVVVSQEQFVIVNSRDLQLFDASSLLGSEHAAVARLNELVQANPALRITLQVVPAFELAA
ncbi:MAG TPA: DUF6603 domain-containing protein [Pyrinomonadaceae bacterium]|nr:DUF6603 domain-containing protein [Pyrinomonadaceae bacterium]